jgi:hypothetical protein
MGYDIGDHDWGDWDDCEADWVGEDGNRLMFHQMSDDYLLNAEAFLRRMSYGYHPIVDELQRRGLQPLRLPDPSKPGFLRNRHAI